MEFPWYGLIALAGICVYGITESVRTVVNRKRAPGVVASRELQQAIDTNRSLQRRLESVEQKVFDLELRKSGPHLPPAAVRVEDQ